MSLLCNLTPYGAATLPSMGRDGRDLIVAVTAARFRLSHPSDSPERALQPADEQPEPPMSDVYGGAPGHSELRLEGQATFARPATDITVAGQARAIHHQPVTSLRVVVSVGSYVQEARVIGDRVWETRLGSRTLRPSPPRPFVSMPLTWERAFGGSARDEDGRLVMQEPGNPFGRGVFREPDAAAGQLLANIEDPRALIESVQDRPMPMGFAPVARWWQPRARYAGTYDDAWQRERAPVWPTDLDDRFFCAAPAALQVRPHLRGGELIVLEGLHHDGIMRFRLPVLRMIVRFRFNERDVRRAMIMDAVIIEPDSGEVTLIHRAAAPVVPSMSAHRETVIRRIEAWEDLVA
jgi:hypothetical protein